MFERKRKEIIKRPTINDTDYKLLAL